MSRPKKIVTREEAVAAILNDPKAVAMLLKGLLATKCVKIGINYPGSIAELLAKMNPDNE